MSKEIGARVRKLRILKGLNQQDMGDKLKITPGAYAKIERGETDPSASRLFQLAAIFKVDIMALLKDEPGTQTTTKKESSISKQDFENLANQVNSIAKEIATLKTDSPAKKSRVRKK